MSNKLIGSFYFKQTVNKNLNGEFTNNKLDRVLTESAEYNSTNDNDSFIGSYNSTWQQDDKNFFATLKIEYKVGSNNSIYLLKWDVRENGHFYGEGFLVDGILIGHYRDFEKI